MFKLVFALIAGVMISPLALAKPVASASVAKCAKIKSACKKGGKKSGKALQSCMDKIVAGKKVKGVSAKKGDIKSCKSAVAAAKKKAKNKKVAKLPKKKDKKKRGGDLSEPIMPLPSEPVTPEASTPAEDTASTPDSGDNVDMDQMFPPDDAAPTDTSSAAEAPSDSGGPAPASENESAGGDDFGDME
ncbi:MAG: hypothetical protein AB7F86_09745 [Bdellovibrionales bacterium]